MVTSVKYFHSSFLRGWKNQQKDITRPVARNNIAVLNTWPSHILWARKCFKTFSLIWFVCIVLCFLFSFKHLCFFLLNKSTTDVEQREMRQMTGPEILMGLQKNLCLYKGHCRFAQWLDKLLVLLRMTFPPARGGWLQPRQHHES